MQHFTDAEFEKTCCELDAEKPDLDSTVDGEVWEFFVESHDVVIYRLYNKESGLYQYKIFGILKDVAPDVCAKVYMDIEYRKQWDSYVNELRQFEEGDKKGIYWQINYPFFMSNRDYVFSRELREIDHKGKKMWVVLAQSQTFQCEPERNGIIRVGDYIQSAALTSDGKGGTKAFMWYYDNPRGSIPTWLINWAAKTGVPGFLAQMQTACRGYPEYLQKRQASS